MKSNEIQKNLKKVVCPISDITHIIVPPADDSESYSNSLKCLRIWATKLFIRMQRGQNVLLSMDCEGWKLGTISKSLGLLQICEILDQSILSHDPQIHPPIKSLNLKSGFLIHFPASAEIIDILSGILHHPKVILCTYDFTSDISSLMEAGIKINTELIFDAQLFCDMKNPLTNTNVSSILNPAREMIGKIKEAQAAYIFMNTRKGNMFDFLTFLHRNDKDPFMSMVDDDFYKYAAGDLVMTALATVHSFTYNYSDITWEMSQLKVKEFLLLQKQFDKLLMPSAIRQASFLKKYNLRELLDYQIRPYTNFSDDEAIKKALTLYVKADMIVNLLNILPASEASAFIGINATRIRDELEKSLELVKARILTLSPFDDDSSAPY